MLLGVEPFYQPVSHALSYVVYDWESRDAVVIDCVLDYDSTRCRVVTRSLDRLLAFIRRRALRVHWALDTHTHEDHLSGSHALAGMVGARTAIGERVVCVQETYRRLLDLAGLSADGSQFDRLLGDGDRLDAGTLSLEVLATHGHTPACVSYRLANSVFVGDVLHLPEFGTGRCDLPRGNADELYRSVNVLYSLPNDSRIYPGHSPQVAGRAPGFCTTVGASKARNIMLKAQTGAEEFRLKTRDRDARLGAPRYMYESMLSNVSGGRLGLAVSATYAASTAPPPMASA